MTTTELEKMLRPEGSCTLDEVIRDVQTMVENPRALRDTQLSVDDLRTLLQAARYGRQRAEEEIARVWGSFG